MKFLHSYIIWTWIIRSYHKILSNEFIFLLISLWLNTLYYFWHRAPRADNTTAFCHWNVILKRDSLKIILKSQLLLHSPIEFFLVFLLLFFVSPAFRFSLTCAFTIFKCKHSEVRKAKKSKLQKGRRMPRGHTEGSKLQICSLNV